MNQILDNVQPFLRFLSPDDADVMKKMGFRLTRLSMDKTVENWLIANIDWTADEGDAWKTKYPTENGSGSSYYAEYGCFSFMEVESPYGENLGIESKHSHIGKVWFEAGIEFENEDSEKQISEYWEYTYSVNTKYGICLYFKPAGFGKIETRLVNHKREDLVDYLKIKE